MPARRRGPGDRRVDEEYREQARDQECDYEPNRATPGWRGTSLASFGRVDHVVPSSWSSMSQLVDQSVMRDRRLPDQFRSDGERSPAVRSGAIGGPGQPPGAVNGNRAVAAVDGCGSAQSSR